MNTQIEQYKKQAYDLKRYLLTEDGEFISFEDFVEGWESEIKEEQTFEEYLDGAVSRNGACYLVTDIKKVDDYSSIVTCQKDWNIEHKFFNLHESDTVCMTELVIDEDTFVYNDNVIFDTEAELIMSKEYFESEKDFFIENSYEKPEDCDLTLKEIVEDVFCEPRSISVLVPISLIK